MASQVTNIYPWRIPTKLFFSYREFFIAAGYWSTSLRTSWLVNLGRSLQSPCTHRVQFFCVNSYCKIWHSFFFIAHPFSSVLGVRHLSCQNLEFINKPQIFYILHWLFQSTFFRARICKLLRSPGIDSTSLCILVGPPEPDFVNF